MKNIMSNKERTELPLHNKKNYFMNRIATCIICLLCMLSLCACALDPLPNLSADDQKSIAEYAVGILMKYDTHHASRILDENALMKELQRLETLAENKINAEILARQNKAAAQKAKEQKAEALENTPVKEAAEPVTPMAYLDEYIDEPNLQIRFTGYEVLDSYPKEGADIYFSVMPTSGKKLLVLNFDVTNVSGEEVLLDMISKNVTFSIRVNDQKGELALSTFLLDDLRSYSGSIPAGGSESLVLIKEIDESLEGNVSSVGVSMKSASKIATILTDAP